MRAGVRACPPSVSPPCSLTCVNALSSDIDAYDCRAMILLIRMHSVMARRSGQYALSRERRQILQEYAPISVCVGSNGSWQKNPCFCMKAKTCRDVAQGGERVKGSRRRRQGRDERRWEQRESAHRNAAVSNGAFCSRCVTQKGSRKLRGLKKGELTFVTSSAIWTHSLPRAPSPPTLHSSTC